MSPTLHIDAAICQVCKRCLVLRSCRWLAVVRPDVEDVPFIDPSRCQHCLGCLERCPYGAVVLA